MFLLLPNKLASLGLRIAYQASHKKALLRSRKKMKKMPMSETKLKEIKSYKSQKDMQLQEQIRERLEHKTDVNRHAREVAQQLFFPDIKYQSADMLAKSFTIEEDTKYLGSLERELTNKLNSELLSVYERSGYEFTTQNLFQFFRQMHYNCKYQQVNKARYIEKWNRYQDTLKRKGHYEPASFPYKFIDEKDLVSHPEWSNIVADVVKRIEILDQKEIVTYMSICGFINNTVGFIPNSIFETMVMKGTQFLKQKSLDVRRKQQFLIFCLQKNRVKLEKKINLEEQGKFKDIINEFINQLVFKLANIKNIKISTVQTLLKALSQSQLEIQHRTILIKRVFRATMKILPQLNFNLTLKAFKLCLDKKFLSHDEVEIFKFDLYRKIETSSLSGTLELLSLIESGVVKGTKVEGISLLEVCNNKVLEYLKEHQLQTTELVNLLKSNYLNGYQNNGSYNLLSNQIVRKTSQIHFEDFTDCFFLLTVVGVKSQYLRDSALQRVIKDVKKLRKQYRQTKPEYLPIRPNVKIIKPLERQISGSEIKLNQQMIKFLWAYLQQSDDNINLNLILQNFPSLEYVITEPMLIDLSHQINKRLKQFNLFPEIRIGKAEDKNYPNLMFYTQKFKTPIRKMLQLQIKIHKQASQSNYNQIQVKQKWSSQGTSEEQYRSWFQKSENDDLFFKTVSPQPELISKLKELKSLHKKKQFRPIAMQQPLKRSENKWQYYQLSQQQN